MTPTAAQEPEPAQPEPAQPQPVRPQPDQRPAEEEARRRADLLAAYDAQERRAFAARSPGWTPERTERVMRAVAPDDAEWGGFVGWTDFTGLPAAEVDAEIARQTAYWTEREGPAGTGKGRRVEWKVYGHDAPADLGPRLEAAGWRPDDLESLVIGEVGSVLAAVQPVQVDGVRFREVDPEHVENDLRRIAASKQAVWGEDYGWLVAELGQELAADPAALRIHLAEADDPDGGPEPVVVCAAWVRLPAGSDFSSLWGGGTRPGWRRRGIYRELVRRRTAQAAELGFRYVQVDASPDSRPILERLGLEVLDWTRPYVLHPSAT